ncbi:MAG: hypothetical protein CMJ90_00615 [Planctomycetes bacterium]|nr:hypothetical protein [Planctomycetota bacterium]
MSQPVLRCLLFVPLLLVDLPAQIGSDLDRNVGGVADAWFAASPNARPEVPADLDGYLWSFPDQVRAVVWESYKEAPLHATMKKDFEEKKVRSGDYVSPYTLKTVGTRPAGGWPLFIAMHGGGGVPKGVNDSQWRIMQRYYKDQQDVEGYLYLALRAPTDQWNGFYTGYVYPLIQNLVRQFLVLGDVDSNRVYIMGYSHGGYGAFSIGPKMPDLFAAIHSSAAAPTGGQSRARNLMNTRFTFMIGEKDTAYGRAARCKEFAATVEKLKAAHADRYPVVMEWKAGHGHGGLPDRNKIGEMYGWTRGPRPTAVSWAPTDGIVKDHFWLRVPDPRAGQSIMADIGAGNRVVLKTQNIDALELWLDERQVGGEAPLTIDWDGVTIPVTAQASLTTLLETLWARGDMERAASRRVVLKR